LVERLEIAYFQERGEQYRPIYRVTLPGLRVEKVVSAAELARDCDLVGLGLDDAPYLRCQSGGTDLYALEWRPSPTPTVFKMSLYRDDGICAPTLTVEDGSGIGPVG
jgi:hypothetical protein